MMADYKELLARLDEKIREDCDIGMEKVCAAAIHDLQAQLEAERKAHDDTKINLETCWRKLEDERKAHDATELRLEQTAANLNHERKTREEAEANCNRLTGMKFSDRMHAALVSRAESAEQLCAAVFEETRERCAQTAAEAVADCEGTRTSQHFVANAIHALQPKKDTT